MPEVTIPQEDITLNGIDTSANYLNQQQRVWRPALPPTPSSSNEISQALVDKSTSPKSATDSFYQYEEQPWLNESGEGAICAKTMYLRYQHAASMIDLALMHVCYADIRNKLYDTHPELAAKKFGFTLDESANLMILDYDNTLSHQERDFLGNLLNNHANLKGLAQRHAKVMMTLLDHDTDTFGNRYSLTLDNFRHTIDYAKILEQGPGKMHKEWIRQVHNNAETRDASNLHIEA